MVRILCLHDIRMTKEDELQAEWCRLSEELANNLDNRRKSAKLRKQLDALWVKMIRNRGL
jgi:hypothetical protein